MFLLEAGNEPQFGIVTIVGGIILYILFLYWVFIRPKKVQQQQLQEKSKNLKKQDKIVTSSGIYGEIALVKEKTFLIQISEKVVIEVLKEHVFKQIEVHETTIKS